MFQQCAWLAQGRDSTTALTHTNKTGHLTPYTVFVAAWVQIIPCVHIRLMRRLRPSAVDADVPGGRALLEDMMHCEKVLMIPDTSIEYHENPYLRPEHEVDLSSLASPSDQGECL